MCGQTCAACKDGFFGLDRADYFGCRSKCSHVPPPQHIVCAVPCTVEDGSPGRYKWVRQVGVSLWQQQMFNWLPGHNSVLTHGLLLHAVLVADITNPSQFPCPVPKQTLRIDVSFSTETMSPNLEGCERDP